MAPSTTPPKKSPGKRVLVQDPFSFILSAMLVVLIGLIVALLIERVRNYQVTRYGAVTLNRRSQEIARLLSKDLLAAAIPIPDCQKPAIVISRGGEKIEISLVNGRYSSSLASPAASNAKGLHLANMAGALPSMLVKLCFHETAERLMIDRTYVTDKSKVASNTEPKDGRVTFVSLDTGAGTLSAGYPQGTAVQSIDEITYEFVGKELRRKSRLQPTQGFTQVSEFTIKNLPDNYAISYTLIDSRYGLEKSYSFDWPKL